MEHLTDLDRGAGDNVFAATVRDYAHNLLLGTTLRRLDPRQLRRLELVQCVLELASASKDPSVELSTTELRAGLATYLKQQHGAVRAPRAPSGPFAENLRWLGELVGLSEDERAVLQLTMLIDSDSDLHDLLASFGRVTTPTAAELIAAALGIGPERVRRALAPGGKLVANRLLQVMSRMLGMDEKFDPKHGLMDSLLTPGLNTGMLVSHLLTIAPPAPIGWEDVTHVEAQARTARDLLAGALRSSRPGVNVLFYGITGAGKTALAHLLAQDLGASLYIAGRGSDLDESCDASDRLSSLMLGHCLLRDGSALMLFDELEDLFRWNWHGLHGERARGEASISKQWFNHL
ncbi:MAG TPA: AAA family ATPase, partial [Polyangiales bacterium]|nr:AAA family ATPase [Polyangiales bacterium]